MTSPDQESLLEVCQVLRPAARRYHRALAKRNDVSAARGDLQHLLVARSGPLSPRQPLPAVSRDQLRLGVVTRGVHY